MRRESRRDAGGDVKNAARLELEAENALGRSLDALRT